MLIGEGNASTQSHCPRRQSRRPCLCDEWVAFTQQYRYAAAESVEPEYVARAISFVLLGPIGGAFLGKELATRGQDWIAGIPYAGTLAALGVLFVLQAALLLMLREPNAHVEHETRRSDRPVKEIIRQPVFLTAVFGGVVAYGVMTTLLTYTYSTFERFRAQAVNEFLVFGMSARASLLAGTVMFYFGWTTLMLVPIPALLAIAAALVLIRKDRLLR